MKNEIKKTSDFPILVSIVLIFLSFIYLLFFEDILNPIEIIVLVILIVYLYNQKVKGGYEK